VGLLSVVFLYTDDTVGALSVFILFQFELYPVSLQQHLPEPRIFYVALVEEHVFSGFCCNKSESLVCVVKLNRAVHRWFFLSRYTLEGWNNKKPRSRTMGWTGAVILCGTLYFSYVRGLQTFRSLFDFELYFIPFVQRFEAITDNGFEVNENVFSALACDKPIAFGRIKPLHRTLFHESLLAKCVRLLIKGADRDP